MARAGAMTLVNTPNSPGTPIASSMRGPLSHEVRRGLTEPAVTAMAANIDEPAEHLRAPRRSRRPPQLDSSVLAVVRPLQSAGRRNGLARAGAARQSSRSSRRHMQMKTALKTSLQRQSGWLIPAGLILLSILPLAGGTLRMVDLVVGDPAPGTLRFFESPSPIVVHVISSLTYFILGAFQFAPSFRRNKPAWHRKAGYVLIPSGLACALSGAWMAWFYPPIFGTGTAVAIIRIVVAASVAAFICLGFVAIRKRNIAAHRAWMM